MLRSFPAVALEPLQLSSITHLPAFTHYFLPDEKRPGVPRFPGKPDFDYLLRIIADLKQERVRKKLGIRELTVKAGLPRGVIGRGERHGVIPKSAEMKAWAAALGLSSADLWSRNLVTPSNITPFHQRL